MKGSLIMAKQRQTVLFDPISVQPIALQILGILSALQFTTAERDPGQLSGPDVRDAFSKPVISVIRNQIPQLDPA